MSEVSAWSKIVEINQRFLRGLACAGIGWVLWQGYLAGIGWCGVLAAMFAAGAALHGAIATFQTVKAIAGTFRWSRFKKQAATPKADGLADRSTLKKRGLL